MADKTSDKSLDYASAGVDIRAGENVAARIKKLAAMTFKSGEISGSGTFGGFFRADFGKMKSPVLVSSTDSVGTKVKLAFMTNRHDTVGEDLVNHCVNDILVHGAKPLFFLDYLGIHRVEPKMIEELVTGVARACRVNAIALVGGETAELPEMYAPGEYDLAGFIVGVVDEPKIIRGDAITEGDVCIGLLSSGLHTNGYTLARKIAFERAGLRIGDRVDECDATIEDSLMAVHRCYASLVTPLLDSFDIHGMAHITGGGIVGNLKRIMPDTLCAEIRTDSWPEPPIFSWLRRQGMVTNDDMYDAFNMGIGFILVLPAAESSELVGALADSGETAYHIGEIVKGERRAELL